MKNPLLLSLCLASLAFAEPTVTSPSTQPAAKDFGEPMKLTDADTIEVAQVLKDPAAYEGKAVRIAGSVTKVCTNKGCWLEMTTPDTTHRLFVKFTCPIDDERLIPENAVGQKAIVEGVIKMTEISEESARHYAEDAGASQEEIEKIKGPQKRVRLMSPAAKLLG